MEEEEKKSKLLGEKKKMKNESRSALRFFQPVISACKWLDWNLYLNEKFRNFPLLIKLDTGEWPLKCWTHDIRRRQLIKLRILFHMSWADRT